MPFLNRSIPVLCLVLLLACAPRSAQEALQERINAARQIVQPFPDPSPQPPVTEATAERCACICVEQVEYERREQAELQARQGDCKRRGLTIRACVAEDLYTFSFDSEGRACADVCGRYCRQSGHWAMDPRWLAADHREQCEQKGWSTPDCVRTPSAR